MPISGQIKSSPDLGDYLSILHLQQNPQARQFPSGGAASRLLLVRGSHRDGYLGLMLENILICSLKVESPE